jgi:PadR family transcriptional regulator, regulatory protein PadR
LCDHGTDEVSCCCESPEGGGEEENDASCCCNGDTGNRDAAARSSCHCGGNIPRHFVLPAILLMLDEEPSHGYSLLRKLNELHVSDGEMSPATVYRILSRLEERGLALHEQVDEGQGPTRKVYMLTDEGRAALAEWKDHIERTRGLLDWFAKRTEG